MELLLYGSWVLVWVISYLMGSISFGFLLTWLIKGVDIRDYESGNAGATNVSRVLGKKIAVLVLLLDGLKGAAAVGLAYWLSGSAFVMATSGLAAIIGHNWPIFLRFRGGKGIATTFGVTLSLAFVPAIIAGLLAIMVISITRYVSLGSLISTSLLPFVILIFTQFQQVPFVYFWVTLVMAGLAIYQHRKNIRALLKGTERKF